MRLRSLVFAALGSAFVLSAAAPAYADHGDWRHHEDHAHAWHPHHDWDRGGYYAPPVVVAPAPVYGGYYAPPPVVFGAPGVSFGVTIR